MQKIPVMVVTVIEATGSTPQNANAKMFVLQSGKIEGTIGGGALEREAIRLALECLQQNQSKKVEINLKQDLSMACGGKVVLYFELLQPAPQLSVFGAGHVGQALCRVLEGGPFLIDLIDPRKEWIQSTRIPESITCHESEWLEYLKVKDFEQSNQYLCILTYSHKEDQLILSHTAAGSWAYLGVIGSRAKWKLVQEGLLHDGSLQKGLSAENLKQVRCPIGNKKLGKSPWEIAIGIAAELLEVYHAKTQD